MFKNYIYVLILALCWSPSYLFIKIAVEDFPPATLALSRISIAAAVLYIICKYQKIRLLDHIKLWPKFLFVGITMTALPFSLINSGEVHITSGLTAIILATIPLFTAFFAQIAIRDHEPLKKRTLFGIIVGFFGVICVYFPVLLQGEIKSSLGILLMLFAATSYAVSTVFTRKHFQDLPSLVGPTYQMIMATIVLLPFAFIYDKPFAMPIPSLGPVLSVIALGLVGTAFAMFMYYKSIKLSGATFTSLNALIVPILAVVLGAIILDEKLMVNAYFGGVIILIALIIANPCFSRKKDT